MSKIDLDPITSGYNLSKINANFQKVEDELNNKVLYRNSPAGEPNSMSSNLDMNSRSVLNASKISSNVLVLGGVQVVPTSLAIDPYNGTREALRRSYSEAGYNLVDGSFEAGGTLVNANDALLHEATGKGYTGPAGPVAPGTDPTSGGFIDVSGYVGFVDTIATLRGITPAVENPYTVLRYYSGGELIYSQYIYDPGDTTSLDDGGSVIVSTSSARFKLVHNGTTTAEQWGIIGDDLAVNNADRMLSANTSGIDIRYSAKRYRTSKWRVNGTRAYGSGVGRTFIDLFYLDTPVMGQFQSNSYTDGFTFNSTEESLAQQRCTFEGANNTQLVNSKVQGFRHAVPVPDAWGCYLKNCSNVKIHAEFENNSQSDVAILEGVHGADIDAHGTSYLHINVEPNSAIDPSNSIRIKSPKINRLDLLENDYTGVSAGGISVEAEVLELIYDGLPAQFIGNSVIGSISSGVDGSNKTFGAAIDFGGAVTIGDELLVDPYLGYVSASDATSAWLQGFSSFSPVGAIDRLITAYGRAIRINPTGVAGHANLQNRVFCPVTAGESYLVSVLSSAIYRAPVNQVGQHLRVIFKDASDVGIQTVTIGINRRNVAGGTTIPSIQAGVVTAPAGAARAYVVLTNGSSTSVNNSVDFYSASFRHVRGSNGNSGQDYRSTHQQVVRKITGPTPLASPNAPTAFVGDELINSQPAAGAIVKWVCVTSGRPGVWKAAGSISA